MREKHVTAGQGKEIEALYSPEEVRTMLKRLGKGSLSGIAGVQAYKMISKRSE